MRLETVVDINAPASVAWAVLANIPQWPTWTESINAVESARVQPLEAGSSATLAVRGAPTATWVVTDVRQGESFTWEAKMRGVKSVAGHEIEPSTGGCRVRLSVDLSGPGAFVFRPLVKRQAQRNLASEAAGLKRRSEELSFAA